MPLVSLPTSFFTTPTCIYMFDYVNGILAFEPEGVHESVNSVMKAHKHTCTLFFFHRMDGVY